jgi:MFS family permease
MAIYLLALLVGGLYVGMVTPVRTVVQEDLGVGDATGIWMITVYTLFYAALIPVAGALGDRLGRKRVFLACMGVFAVGAALCGAAGLAGSFALLLAGRVVQAAGACGVIPLANAEMGTAFPPERRGMALGMSAAVSGIANVLGAAVGSAILQAVGPENWPALFFACLPLCAALVVAGVAFLPDRRPQGRQEPLDAAGSVLMVAFVLLLLLGLQDLDFADLAASLESPLTWGPLAGAVLALAAFLRVEKTAGAPIFHLSYLRSRPIVVTMAASFFVGCIIISMTLVPEFAEAALGLPAGAGGYYVIAVGATSLFGPPLGGKLIDRLGARPVLAAGLAVLAAGYLFLALVTVAHPAFWTVVAGLVVVGLGMGFAMGAPLNYMILENTRPEEAGSAVATVTLVRQVGTSLAPSFFLGFVASDAGVAGWRPVMLAVAACGLAALALTLRYRPEPVAG